jgi:hypothetical protein
VKRFLATLRQINEFVPLVAKVEALSKALESQLINIDTELDLGSEAHRKAIEAAQAKLNADLDALR